MKRTELKDRARAALQVGMTLTASEVAELAGLPNRQKAYRDAESYGWRRVDPVSGRRGVRFHVRDVVATYFPDLPELSEAA